MKFYYQIEGTLRNNIGDVLQGMVAKRFLPNTSHIADREALSNIDTTSPSLLLANGWYMHSFDNFPPPPNVTPIYISVHIAQSKLLNNKKVREHFLMHSPIGCRDKKTLKLFLGWGIPAYYSSCLTITTTKRAEINNTSEGEIILVDNIDHPIPEKIKTKLEQLLNKPLVRITHDPPKKDGSLQEFMEDSEKHMNSLLKRYCKASLVITSKIHCALPCLGMGANVMLIHPNPADPRLATVAEFLAIKSYNEILKSKVFSYPKINKGALNKKKKLLFNIINKSIINKSNIIQQPDTYGLNTIKIKSTLMAKAYSTGIKIMLKTGLANSQIKKVFGISY